MAANSILAPTESTDNLKRCTKCGELKPREAFSVEARMADGLRSDCRACRNARHHEWYLANQDTQRAESKARREANPESERERHRPWRERNPEARRAHEQTRRAKERAINGSFSTSGIEAIRVAQGNRCYLCGKKLKAYHIDHFIPLALGGTNDPGNLRLACPACNLSKHAKHPFERGVLL